MLSKSILTQLWLALHTCFQNKWNAISTIQTKILLMTIGIVCSSFAVVGIIGVLAFGQMVSSFIKVLENRSSSFLEVVTKSSERSKNNLVAMMEENARAKGENLIKKDSLILREFIQENSIMNVRSALQNSFDFDNSILVANFIVVEEGEIKSWQYIDRQNPTGLPLPILYDKNLGQWSTKNADLDSVVDSSVREITKIDQVTIRKIQIERFPRDGSKILAYEAIVPIFEGSKEDLSRLLQSGESIAYLRYIISLEQLTNNVQMEHMQLENLISEQKKNSSETLSSALKQVRGDLLKTFLIMLLVGGVVIILASYLSIMMSRYMTASLKVLSKASENMSAGAYDVIIAINQHDEIGVLGRNFEIMRLKIKNFTEKLQELVEERTEKLNLALLSVTEKSHKIQGILNHIDLGIMTIDNNLAISTEYSSHLRALFKNSTGEIAGNTALEFLFADSDVSRDSLNRVEAILLATIGEDSFNWELNSKNLPRKVQYHQQETELTFEFHWNPMILNGLTQGILVSVRDLTKEIGLEREVIRHKNESSHFLNTISTILAVPNTSFRMAYIDCDRRLKEIEKNIFINFDSRYAFVQLHTMKGTGRSLGFNKLTNFLHDAESHLQGMNESYSDNMQVFSSSIAAIRSELEYIRNVAVGTLKINLLNGDEPSDFFTLMADAVNEAQKNCKDHGMEIHEISLQSQIVDWNQELLSDFFHTSRHIIANSLDHGYFSPKNRGLIKSDEGIDLEISAIYDSDYFIFSFRDRGIGFDRKAVRAIADKKGLTINSDEELLKVLLIAGVSTAENVTVLSGRGVGLGAIQTFASKWEGEVVLSDNKPRGSVITIKIPHQGVNQDKLLISQRGVS